MENGVTQTAIGNGIWTRASIAAAGNITSNGTISSVGSMSAPTYYDRDDPSYYINPNGGSQVNTIYANGWFRAQGDT